MNRHTDRLKTKNPYIVGMAAAIYQAFLAAIPEYGEGVTRLTFSQIRPAQAEIGVEICENVFFNETTGVVFVLLPAEAKEEKTELAAGQIGPQGVIL